MLLKYFFFIDKIKLKNCDIYGDGVEVNDNDVKIRVRYAPSPTGYMHVGNLRSALYNYLVSKSLGGKFILRIEDTDQKRKVEGAEKIIFDTLEKTKLICDEGPLSGGDFGPYIQSERKDIYEKYSNELIKKGHAYYCFCEKFSPGSLSCKCREMNLDDSLSLVKSGKKHVIRQKIPKSGVSFFDDVVFGHIEVENSELEDQVLIKSDGMPTYNFANVVDDHLMQISHVIRGCEYLSATPKYNLLYESFGWKIPVYVHLPLIMGKNPDGSVTKLSKRAGAVSFVDLVNEGYLPEAIINYIAFLGWNPGSTQEIFTLSELEKAFSIDGIRKSPAIFDYEKLSWVNEKHIQMKSDEEFAEVLKDYVDFEVDLLKLAKVLKSRVSKLSQIKNMIDFFRQRPDVDENLVLNKKNKVDKSVAKEILSNVIDKLKSFENWDNDSLYEELAKISSEMGLKKNAIMWVVRISSSGKEVTPGGATEILDILGKDESLIRLNEMLKKLS